MLLNGKRGLGWLLAEYGISAGRLPSIAGEYRGKGLVICGDAACVWADLEMFGCRSDERGGSVARAGFDFMTVNKMVETFPGEIEHAYSNNGHVLRLFCDARRQEFEQFPFKHLHACTNGGKWLWPWPAAGTSGLGATLTGVALGYLPVVLCGIPLDDGPHNGEPPWRRTKFASSEAAGADGGPDKHWKRAIEAFRGIVYSMSGRTQEWFGSPRNKATWI